MPVSGLGGGTRVQPVTTTREEKFELDSGDEEGGDGDSARVEANQLLYALLIQCTSGAAFDVVERHVDDGRAAWQALVRKYELVGTGRTTSVYTAFWSESFGSGHDDPDRFVGRLERHRSQLQALKKETGDGVVRSRLLSALPATCASLKVSTSNLGLVQALTYDQVKGAVRNHRATVLAGKARSQVDRERESAALLAQEGKKPPRCHTRGKKGHLKWKCPQRGKEGAK